MDGPEAQLTISCPPTVGAVPALSEVLDHPVHCLPTLPHCGLPCQGGPGKWGSTPQLASPCIPPPFPALKCMCLCPWPLGWSEAQTDRKILLGYLIYAPVLLAHLGMMILSAVPGPKTPCFVLFCSFIIFGAGG